MDVSAAKVKGQFEALTFELSNVSRTIIRSYRSRILTVTMFACQVDMG